MEKEFVTHDQAMRLKALGFDEPCVMYIDDEGDLINDDTAEWIGAIKCPLKSQAFRWFREKYNLYHSIDTRVSKDIGYYIFLNDKEIYDDSCYWNYKEAELACLDKLIEIVESKSE